MAGLTCYHRLRQPTPNHPEPRDCMKCGRIITASDERKPPQYTPPVSVERIYSL